MLRLWLVDVFMCFFGFFYILISIRSSVGCSFSLFILSVFSKELSARILIFRVRSDKVDVDKKGMNGKYNNSCILFFFNSLFKNRNIN